MEFEEYQEILIQFLKDNINCEISKYYEYITGHRIRIQLRERNSFKLDICIQEPFEKLRYNLNGNIDEHSLRKEVKIMIRRIEEEYLDNTIRRK